MKRFIVSVLSAAVFFIGLGGLVERAGARFKSDERALEIIKQARAAVGGEDAIRQARSLTIAGRATQTFNFDGNARVEQGDVEINLQLPDRFAKIMKFGDATGGGASGEKIVSKNIVVIKKDGGDADFNADNSGGAKRKVVIVKNGEAANDVEEILKNGANVDGAHKFIINKDVQTHGDGGFRQNELFRTALALLLSAPEGLDVNYTYVSEGSVDGIGCDVIQAQAAGDASAVKLFISKSSHLPVMMSYQGTKPLVIKIKKEDALPQNDANRDVKVFVRHAEPDAAETAEIQVKFSDYRAVGGLQLPFKWTQTANGQPDNTLDVSSYEINPTNIADKFQKQMPRVMIKKQ